MAERVPMGSPTLVALHGHGDDAASARRWARAAAPPGWDVEAPPSPMGPDGVASWFATGPRGVDAGELRRSVDQVARVVSAAVARGPVVVAGFSQGAAVALALPSMAGLSGVVALCAFLPESDDLDPGSGPPALVLAGAGDEVVPAFLGQDAAAALASAGRAVTIDTLPGGHEVTATMAERVTSWLQRRCPLRMSVSLGLPVERVDAGAELVSGSAVVELASAWERLGFDAAWVTDHPAPDDRWLAGGGHHALEPTVVLGVAAAATSTLLVHTHVLVLGYRNPFLAAKALASVDVLSGGRLVLGVAAGYLRPEFAALGSDFEQRGARLDAALELLPEIWGTAGVAVEGHGFSARSVTALPRPAQRPHPPIWVGGNSERAMRRAARLGDGWSPFPTLGGLERATRTASIRDHRQLAARLDRFVEVCAEEGRGGAATLCFSPFSLGGWMADPDHGLAPLCDEVQALWDLGIDWVALSVPGRGRAEVIERAEALSAALGLSSRS